MVPLLAEVRIVRDGFALLRDVVELDGSESRVVELLPNPIGLRARRHAQEQDARGGGRNVQQLHRPGGVQFGDELVEIPTGVGEHDEDFAGDVGGGGLAQSTGRQRNHSRQHEPSHPGKSEFFHVFNFCKTIFGKIRAQTATCAAAIP